MRLLAFVLLAGVAGHAAIADAKAKKTDQTDTKKKKKKDDKKKKKANHESTAVGKDHKFAVDSMPQGWSWPPTQAMHTQEQACEAHLDEAGVAWQAGKQDGRIVDAITLPEMTIDGIAFVGWSNNPYVMDCQLALAFARFAPKLYELGVREVHFGSIYRWTKVRAFGRTENMLSRHALGIAMDIVSFVDDTGRTAVVGKDYKKNDPLLLGVEKAVNDSGLFRILLTPKNDPKSHSDHFHIETKIDFADGVQLNP